MSEKERESVNLVDLFNFAEECERNKFNYKLGDFTKIDFFGGEEGRDVKNTDICNLYKVYKTGWF